VLKIIKILRKDLETKYIDYEDYTDSLERTLENKK
jgi:hypothetical protein